MTDASRYLLSLAKRNAETYAANPKTQAIMVAGSVAEGLSDFYSDIDMTIYYHELPSEEELAAARQQNRGSERLWLLGDRNEGSFAESYMVDGVECQIGHTTIPAWEESMASVQEKFDVISPLQKALSGTQVCIPLYGEPLIQQWKAKANDYSDALAQVMVEKHLTFFPIWAMPERFLQRDAALWLHQIIVEAEQNILGILSGLNRLYYSTFQFKRTDAFISKMHIAPSNLSPRLKQLLVTDSVVAISQLKELVEETVVLVESYMPGVDTSTVWRQLTRRQQPWTPDPAIPISE